MAINNISESVSIYESDSSPFGVSYDGWTKRWWRWLISIPKHKSPALDMSGDLCDTSQNNPNIWYLAGVFSGTVVRKCSIPYGKAILLPIINYECSFADETSIKSESELEERCRNEIDKIADLTATLDGDDIDVQNYRVHSRCFKIEIPRDNCLDSPEGVTTMASDGYWIFIKPLSRGSHELRTFGSCLAGKIKIGCNLNIEIV